MSCCATCVKWGGDRTTGPNGSGFCLMWQRMKYANEGQNCLSYEEAAKTEKTPEPANNTKNVNSGWWNLQPTVYRLDPKEWESLIKILEKPPKPNAKLRKLLKRKPIWDK